MGIKEFKDYGNGATDNAFDGARKIYQFARAIRLDDENDSELGNAYLMAEQIMAVAEQMMAQISGIDERADTERESA